MTASHDLTNMLAGLSLGGIGVLAGLSLGGVGVLAGLSLGGVGVLAELSLVCVGVLARLSLGNAHILGGTEDLLQILGDPSSPRRNLAG